jgi:hypothetical protein
MAALRLENFKDLMVTPEPPELGPGPRKGVQPEAPLRKALDEHFRGTNLASEREQLVRALILLWHDHLDAAHGIAQDVANADGAFVHGIMHRREPDYGNAGYWFHRVGKHPAFVDLAANLGTLAGLKADADLREKLIPKGKWDAMGMISACEQAARAGRNSRETQTLREVQQIETETLISWLLREAKG